MQSTPSSPGRDLGAASSSTTSASQCEHGQPIGYGTVRSSGTGSGIRANVQTLVSVGP